MEVLIGSVQNHAKIKDEAKSRLYLLEGLSLHLFSVAIVIPESR